MLGDGGNPFRMPTDEEVFILRDEEKRQKIADRERLKGQRVHEKTTWSTRIGAAHGHSNDDTGLSDDARAAVGSIQGSLHLPTIEIREKDNMAQYIQKKRDMGLARMSLATKRQEIKKLDEEADRAEKRLKQQQDQLISTQEKFNNFLKHSNLEQDAAVKRADIETKAKQEKLMEIKKLSAQIAQLEADKKKNEEQMEQCLGFKKFLDDLTKPSWFYDTVIALRVEDERQRILQAMESQMNDDAIGDLEAEEQERRQEEMLAKLEARVDTATLEVQKAVEQHSLDDVKQTLDAYNPSRVPMFFTEPNQILEQFVNIEEGNLFLIQNCQELEEEIENIASLYQQEQNEMQSISAQRKQQMEAITSRIHVEQAKMRTLMERLERVLGTDTQAAANANDDPNATKKPGEKKDAQAAESRTLTQEELKTRIEEKIKSIFRTLNNLADETNMDSLGMLTFIETKLEEMRQYIKNPKNGIEESFVATVMRQRDKERRRQARQVMLNKQAEEREERSRKALERSQAPVVKRVGKPVMWRSRPIDKKKKETVAKQETATEQDDEFFM